MPTRLVTTLERWLSAFRLRGVAPLRYAGAVAPPKRLPPHRSFLCRRIPRREGLRRRGFGRRGFTLLEVILALAILAGALAAIGEVIRSATRNASESRELTRAQLLAASIMAEMTSGVAPPQEVSGVTVDIESIAPWTYSVEIQPTELENLVALHVTVAQDTAINPLSYSLVRWIPDPGLVVTDASSTTSSSGSSSGSSSSSGASSSSGGSSSPSGGQGR